MTKKTIEQCCVRFCRQTTTELPYLAQGQGYNGFVEVQNFLKRYGFIALDAPVEPGMLCPKTAKGLETFQKFYGLRNTEAVSKACSGVPKSEPVLKTHGSHFSWL